MDYDEQEYDLWLDDVAHEMFVLLGEELNEFGDIDYLNYFLEGFEPEMVVREIYESGEI